MFIFVLKHIISQKSEIHTKYLLLVKLSEWDDAQFKLIIKLNIRFSLKLVLTIFDKDPFNESI